jgi:hypothetical protein
MHEASMSSDNSFITLTYSKEFLPKNGSVDKEAFPGFMKRLRNRFDRKIRYYYCAEYGEDFLRPHYHGLMFNLDFEDKYLWTYRDGFPVWRSPTLEKCWKFGFSEIGTLTFESAGYVSRYCTKKVYGQLAEDYYGEYEPEFARGSNRPGIGASWIQANWRDVYPEDRVVVARPDKPVFFCKPPRYYDKLLFDIDPEMYHEVMEKRRVQAIQSVFKKSFDRLEARRYITSQKMGQLPRSMEINGVMEIPNENVQCI